MQQNARERHIIAGRRKPRRMLTKGTPHSDDRRRSQRFALPLALTVRRAESLCGANRISTGECLNISSRGLLFTTTESLAAGESVEVRVDWPIVLDARIRLILVIRGQIVRAGGGRAAMCIERYEFKTSGLAGWRWEHTSEFAETSLTSTEFSMGDSPDF
jgi:PilZ domain